MDIEYLARKVYGVVRKPRLSRRKKAPTSRGAENNIAIILGNNFMGGNNIFESRLAQ